MVNIDLIRAPLFVPANRPERFAKAAASGADAVILDLEDAVADNAKETARATLASDFTDVPVIVRINGHGTVWHERDVAAAAKLHLAAVMVPKAEDPAVLSSIWQALGGLPLIALIETARGVAAARSIAAAVRLAFGSVDYCADLDCAHLREVLLPVRSELVLASRLVGIAAPIDGVTLQLDDAGIAHDDACHARDLGLTGKLCIHPKQIAGVVRAFLPSPAEVDWAQRVLASGDGVALIDRIMVDEPVRIRARALLAQFE
ncbi:CoA ester lyase [Aminobacter sp. AP02]|uniref:HpcH/HpaI aldolase/citrate lyase family protein n=1 Tax=Aminobacter sp. AP02 TaxID=2135737 RepID=UPI000D6CF96B|nr:CoA ester lyase [Aminobacter sp. AP02]PWK61273.1 citrate lyase subunit beta/citryl-CoA lyase [Aminobacter sp. AP02]